VGHGILENVNGAAGQHTRSRAADYEIHKGPARRNKGTRTREDAVSRKREKERRVAGRALKEKERERERGGGKEESSRRRIIGIRRKGKRDEAAG